MKIQFKKLVNEQKHLKLVRDITRFYDEATADYAFWSKHMNMHYGYMKSPIQFFNREAMLEQMNLEVFDRLQLNQDAIVIDSGCGTGATARALVRNNDTARVVGVNVVASHVELGKKLNRQLPQAQRINLLHADFHDVPLPKNLADAAYAMESACHSYNKAAWIEEMHRLLKPGAKLVITDCFLRNPNQSMSGLSRWAYNIFRKCWSVPHLAEINLFEQMLKDAGFGEIQIEDIRWKVAPSVLHSPVVVLRYVLYNLITGRKTGRESWKNLKAVLLSILIGLDTRSFSYYIVTATKY